MRFVKFGGRLPARSICTSVVLLCGIYASSAQGASLLWDFNSGLGLTSGSTPGLTAGSFGLGNNLKPISTPWKEATPPGTTTYVQKTGSPPSQSYNLANMAVQGSLNTATSAYYSVLLTPTGGGKVKVTDIAFASRGTNTGPLRFTLRSSADNYATDIMTIVNTADVGVWAYYDATFAAYTAPTNDPIELRLFMHDRFDPTNPPSVPNVYIDDILLDVEVVGVPEPSAMMLLATGGILLMRRRRA